VPHQQAGHMTAPDQCCINVKKLLSIRRRPHMTQSGHWAAKFAVMHNTAETAMMCSVEPGQGNEAALQSRCCID
jgi:hypothetical protein